MSDVDDEDTVPAPVTIGLLRDVPLPTQKPPPPPVVVEKKPAQEVFTIEDSDDAEPKRKERKKERESRPKKRKRSRYLKPLIPPPPKHFLMCFSLFFPFSLSVIVSLRPAGFSETGNKMENWAF